MSGTKLGGMKAAITNRQEHGLDFYQRIGAKGGQAKVPKGFAIDDRTWKEKLLGKPKRASTAGRKGGTASRRTK